MNDEEFIKQIGEKLKNRRIELGLTQLQLADMTNMEDSAIRRIEAGRTNPTLKTLLKISKALSVELVLSLE